MCNYVYVNVCVFSLCIIYITILYIFIYIIQIKSWLKSAPCKPWRETANRVDAGLVALVDVAGVAFNALVKLLVELLVMRKSL